MRGVFLRKHWVGFACAAALVVCAGGAPMLRRALLPDFPPAIEAAGAPVTEAGELRIGEPVIAAWRGQHYRARVLETLADGRLSVFFVGYGMSSRQTVARSDLRLTGNSEAVAMPRMPQARSARGPIPPDPSALTAGQHVVARWFGHWYDAVVVAVREDGPVVQFAGFDAAWKHVPRRDDIRIP